MVLVMLCCGCTATLDDWSLGQNLIWAAVMHASASRLPYASTLEENLIQ